MKRLIAIASACLCFAVSAQEATFQAPFKDLRPPKDDIKSSQKNLKRSNDVDEVIGFMSPVKSQGSRGTCSIFSAVAMVEALFIRDAKMSLDVDLSEEWVEFISISQRNATEDGSWSMYNWNLIAKYGVPTEETLPYVTSNWTSAAFGTAKDRCGHLTENKLKTCLLAHFDPQYLRKKDSEIQDELFLAARAEAKRVKRDHIDSYFRSISSPWSWEYRVSSVSEIKKNLRSGIPMTMAIDVYYGAWNHRKANELGIGVDSVNWSKGIISNPEPGSVDLEKSPTMRAGHSVLIVGYDDDKEIEHTMKMKDGSMKTFKYRGVYYFKNSWGTTNFGRETEINGVHRPGYGMISYKYANARGTFYNLPIR